MIYKCSLCVFSTSLGIYYQKHLKSAHGTSPIKDEAQSYFCEPRSFTAPDRRAYQRHLHGKKHKNACKGVQVTIRHRRDTDSTSYSLYTQSPLYLNWGLYWSEGVVADNFNLLQTTAAVLQSLKRRLANQHGGAKLCQSQRILMA